MQSTASVLLKKSILKPSGEISKDKINLVAGAITQPFAEMVWVTTGGDKVFIPFPLKTRFYCVTKPQQRSDEQWQFSAWNETAAIP